MDLKQLEAQPKAESAAKSKTVIVWGRNDLLGWAVDFFLSARKDWRVINLSNKRGLDGLFHEVEKARPDTVIVYQRDCARSAYLPAQLLQNYPDVTVITVNPDNNSMEVYNKKHIRIEEISDFISGVDSNSHSIHQGGI
jgi:polynucleotide 5'-kinase involved in rRNA processing